MELSELLYELRENILNDRSDRTAGDPDVLWSDETLVRYINEAQRRFARQGLIIRDGTTPAVTQVTLETGVEFYTLHKSVLAVVSARLAGDTFDLTKTNHEALGAHRAPDDFFTFQPTQGNVAPGRPIAFTTDEYLSANATSDTLSQVTLRVFPAPSEDQNGTKVNLRVLRMPLSKLVIGEQEVPDIPEDHRLEMLDWAAYLALRVNDIDAGSPSLANQYRQSFELHAREARRVAMRKLFAPMGWGFGRGGWSWEK